MTKTQVIVVVMVVRVEVVIVVVLVEILALGRLWLVRSPQPFGLIQQIQKSKIIFGFTQTGGRTEISAVKRNSKNTVHSYITLNIVYRTDG